MAASTGREAESGKMAVSVQSATDLFAGEIKESNPADVHSKAERSSAAISEGKRRRYC
jgi:hypothetical protein